MASGAGRFIWADDEEEADEQREQEESRHAAPGRRIGSTPDLLSERDKDHHAGPHKPPRQAHGPAIDSWRRHEPLQNSSPLRSGPAQPPSSSSFKSLASQPHAGFAQRERPHGSSPAAGFGGSPAAGFGSSSRPASRTGEVPEPPPRRVSNTGSGAGAPSAALHDAVSAACLEVVQPYCKAMAELLHQMLSSVTTQVPKAVAAACAKEGATGAVDSAAVQKALLIGMAPMQEQIAQLQRALAHVPSLASVTINNNSHSHSSGGSAQPAPPPPPPPPPPLPQQPSDVDKSMSADKAASTPPSGLTPTGLASLGSSGLVSMGSGRQAPLMAPNLPATLTTRPSAKSPSPSASFSHPRPLSSGGGAPASAPAGATSPPHAGSSGGGGTPSSFADRARAAAAEKAAAAAAAGMTRVSHEGEVGDGGSEEGRDGSRPLRPPHKVKAGFQAYRTPVRRHGETDT